MHRLLLSNLLASRCKFITARLLTAARARIKPLPLHPLNEQEKEERSKQSQVPSSKHLS